MKVPYCKYAYASRNKIEYLISLTHVVGKHKAVVFRSRGFNESNMDLLEDELLNIINSCDIVSTRITSWGVGYRVDGLINTPDGRTINLTTAWFVDNGKRPPRFVSAYPV